MSARQATESIVRDIKRRTRKKYTAEEKISIVLEGLRDEESIAAICRRERISPNLYYRWSKDFLEAGKRRLLGDMQREATSFEVTELKQVNEAVREIKRVKKELYMPLIHRPGGVLQVPREIRVRGIREMRRYLNKSRLNLTKLLPSSASVPSTWRPHRMGRSSSRYRQRLVLPLFRMQAEA